jgi:hypothetical protein
MTNPLVYKTTITRDGCKSMVYVHLTTDRHQIASVNLAGDYLDITAKLTPRERTRLEAKFCDLKPV